MTDLDLQQMIETFCREHHAIPKILHIPYYRAAETNKVLGVRELGGLDGKVRLMSGLYPGLEVVFSHEAACYLT